MDATTCSGTRLKITLGVGRGASALAVCLGVGRFVYTPILPLMHSQAGLSAPVGAVVATANYLGYFVGALLTVLAPLTFRTRAMLRTCLVALVVTTAGMTLTSTLEVWFMMRALSGAASAVVFVIAVNAMLRTPGAAKEGWTFAGAGVGIALSGLLVVSAPFGHDWKAAWWCAATLSVVLAVGAWSLPTGVVVPATNARPEAPRPRTTRLFLALIVSYFLEGVGYIIAGTFLVAAVTQTAPGFADLAWVLVGLAAIPGCVLWAGLSRRWPRAVLLPATLALQAVGVALPALSSSSAAALVAAVLFGGTFMAIGMIVLPIGAQLRARGSVAVLTVAYSLGQIVGPLLVAPLLDHGYGSALLVGAVVVAGAAGVAVLLCLGNSRSAPAPVENAPTPRASVHSAGNVLGNPLTADADSGR
ncbi:YbfB/YjiJ family MFS transporter [Streptacidiphilus fuscans]|uniref:YbfB/YjiJ family MFS transporter n=1 Tax=Streptacidiphilus fuscans TaxID=2789292 RepID=A0A931AZZ6_9ACTN|nr:YbfB/YjiJ family MFS transporter [Streptacidiphilus fuscans]MBF9067693.1 YbfB/YjiJ family MFS transporter [Streptacidiphilus fuscans]